MGHIFGQGGPQILAILFSINHPFFGALNFDSFPYTNMGRYGNKTHMGHMGIQSFMTITYNLQENESMDMK